VGNMWNIDKIVEYLKKHLKESRFNHTLGVVETAKKLAIKNGVDPKRVEIAALVHDCAKNMKLEESLKILKDKNIKLDAVLEASPQLLHGKVGAIIGKSIFGIQDDEILSAVEYHTTGKANMTLLEKIIYIADYIEPNRSYREVDELRKITFEDLDKGVLKGLDNTIILVIKDTNLIHPLTIDARNCLIEEIKTKKF
jgi:predicted HD superfamily hydrolase involved in NAD metabolism